MIGLSRLTLSVILLVGIAFLGGCAFFTLRLDYVIHHDLYGYGLQFSEEWAIQAWTYKDFTLASIGVSIATNFFGLFYLAVAGPTPVSREGESWRRKIETMQKMSLALIAAGCLVLTASVIFESSAAALVGLGLVFWGAILFYVRTGKLVKETLFNTTAFASLATLGRVIAELGYRGPAIYLPPKYLIDIESNRAFISQEDKTTLPSTEQLPEETEFFFIENPKGIILEPPGGEVTRLLEEVLETSFARTDLQYFEQRIPPALVEDLEIAQNVEIKRQEKKLRIKLENTIYAELCDEHHKLTEINGSMGCPMCSALACVIAKTTGKPVVIEKEEVSRDDRTIETRYRLVDQI